MIAAQPQTQLTNETIDLLKNGIAGALSMRPEALESLCDQAKRATKLERAARELAEALITLMDFAEFKHGVTQTTLEARAALALWEKISNG